MVGAKTPAGVRGLKTVVVFCWHNGYLMPESSAMIAKEMKCCLLARGTESDWPMCLVCLIAFLAAGQAAFAGMPAPVADSAAEPVRYVGTEQTDRRFFDGALRHAVGVHSYQAFRANRSHPTEGGRVGWTYNHQPFLAYWQGHFYLQYLSDPTDEHGAPGRTLLMTSKDGFAWSAPQIVFPEYRLPKSQPGEQRIPAGAFAVMHQRMGFYTAPDGRLLTLGFYGYSPTPYVSPNNGQGLGRVVREVYPNGKYGPIYFIRYNRHAGWNETNTHYPLYTKSRDQGFVAACDALLADKLATLQWWEEDRGEDGFFSIDLNGVEPKALAYCHRPDGVVLGVWKSQVAALSADEGRTWTKLARCPTLMDCSAKTWVQRTDDGRYALVYNHSATRRNRFPLVVMTSEDCRDFDHMLCLHGEVPPMRFQGLHKSLGPQYVRGIEEGNGQPPGDHLWNTYSMHKEDIWVSRTRIPVSGVVTESVDENFNTPASAAELEHWNLYSPLWARVSVVAEPGQRTNRCLELRDAEPYDYALAERAFPESRRLKIAFRVQVRKAGVAALDCEVQDRQGQRPLRLHLDGAWLAADLGRQRAEPYAIKPGQWLNIQLALDCATQSYELSVNGSALRKIPFAKPVESVERLVFRTGPWRGAVPSEIVDGQPARLGLDEEDLPGADEKVAESIFLLDDVMTTNARD